MKDWFADRVIALFLWMDDAFCAIATYVHDHQGCPRDCDRG